MILTLLESLASKYGYNLTPQGKSSKDLYSDSRNIAQTTGQDSKSVSQDTSIIAKPKDKEDKFRRESHPDFDYEDSNKTPEYDDFEDIPADYVPLLHKYSSK